MSSLDDDLAALLADPRTVELVSPDDIPDLIGKLERLKASLLAKLMAASSGNGEATNSGPQSNQPRQEDRLLTAQEAAVRLGISTDYLYRNKRLPFRVRLPQSSKVLFSSQGIERYLKNRQGK